MSLSPFDIEGVWRGHYHYRRIFGLSLMPSVPCYAVFKRDDETVSGQIFEPNSFGRRATDHLEADLLNLELGNGLIRFRKKYNGIGGVSHGIDYKGEISNDGRKIHGTWNIGWLSSGTFDLEKEDPEKAEPFRDEPALAFKRPPPIRWPFFAVAGFLAALFVSSIWAIRLSPEARDAREFLSTMPETRIVEIRIEPDGPKSPAPRVIRITDRKRIAELAAAFRAAAGMSPNHPSTQWSVTVRFITAEREYGGRLSQTSNQGVLFWYSSGVTSGWNYGTYRNDGLGPMIQGILKDNASE